MTDRAVGIVVCIILSLLLSLVQIAYESKITNWKSYFTVQSTFYIVIMTFGNILSTFLAEGLVAQMTAKPNDQGLILTGPLWVWYSAIGVFGFEAIIQKVNLTIFDKGIFALNDWLNKARGTAIAATLDRAADLRIFTEQDLGPQLHKTVQGSELHTLVIGILGNDLYNRALTSIQGNQNIIPDLYLASIAASEAPKKVKAVIKSRKANN